MKYDCKEGTIMEVVGFCAVVDGLGEGGWSLSLSPTPQCVVDEVNI